MIDSLENLSYRLAIDNIGIYPMSVKGGKRPYEKRTERMEGHNEAVMEITRKAGVIAKWIEEHPHREKIERALMDETIDLHEHNGKIKLFVNCNDVFYWACSDLEEITPEEIDELENCIKQSEKHGPMLWTCRKRNMRPQLPWYKEFSEEEKKLFDACGPARDPKDEG